MNFWIREGTPNEQQVVAAVHATQPFARRLIVLGMLLTIALVAFAVQPLRSGAATTTTPGVSSVTVTVPGSTPPAPTATAPATNPPPASVPSATPPAPVTPSPSSPTPSTTPPAQTPPASTAPAPAVGASAAVGTPAHHAHHSSTRARRHTAISQRQLRSLVVRLSGCVSTLNPASQRLLLLRTGVSGAGPRSRRAVARTLHISAAREARLEHAALLRLRRAARKQRCGTTPAWVHVPAGNRLVLIDPVLTTTAPSSTKISFAPSSPISGLVFTWWRLAWTPPQQS